LNCPHCNQPIPDAAVVKAAASIVGRRKRPGSLKDNRKTIRNPWGIKGKPKEETK
jgi:hypothetical protein